MCYLMSISDESGDATRTAQLSNMGCSMILNNYKKAAFIYIVQVDGILIM